MTILICIVQYCLVLFSIYQQFSQCIVMYCHFIYNIVLSIVNKIVKKLELSENHG